MLENFRLFQKQYPKLFPSNYTSETAITKPRIRLNPISAQFPHTRASIALKFNNILQPLFHSRTPVKLTAIKAVLQRVSREEDLDLSRAYIYMNVD